MNAIPGIENYLLKIFDIKREELRKTMLLQFNIFLLITVLLIVKPTIYSLFLSELSSKALPVGYVLTAFSAVIGSYFYNKSLKKNSLLRVMEVTNISCILILFLFAFIIKRDFLHAVFLYVPYVWVSIFGLLTASQFWLLANMVYNVREAKRVFGFIGAGAIAGGIFGGYVASILASLTSSENLFYVAAVLLFFCIPITRYIWKHEIGKLNEFQLSHRHISLPENPFRIIREQKILFHLSIIIGIGVLVAKLVDFQYSDYASKFFTNEDELTAFLGFWLSTLSLISLIIQLFLTKKIVGIFGVGRSLYWLPVGVLAGTILLFVFPILPVVVAIKIADGSLKQSINKAATELVSIPIPLEIKRRTKTFIDVVVDSIATGIAGLLLFFLIRGLDVSSTQVGYLTIFLIGVWIWVIGKLKKEYIEVFKNELLKASGEKITRVHETIPLNSIVGSVKRVLQEGNDSQKIFMLNRVLEEKDDRFFREILDLLEHPNAAIRSLALENLYYMKSPDVSDKVLTLLDKEEEEVCIEAFRYLLKNKSESNGLNFEQYLNHENITISNAALIALASEFRNNSKLQFKYNLQKHINNFTESLDDISDTVLKNNRIVALMEAIGMGHVETHYDFIFKHLSETPLEDLNKVLSSAARSLDFRFVEFILPYLLHKESRIAARDALFIYGPGLIPKLTNLLLNDEIHKDYEHFIPQVIEHFESQLAVNSLIRIIDHSDHDVKSEAIESLRRLKWKDNHLIIKDSIIVNKILGECELYLKTLAVIHSQILIQYKRKNSPDKNPEEDEARNGLITLLEQRLDRQLHRIFHFLGLKYPPSDVDPIFNVITKGKEEQRLNAIEFLDNILETQLKKELIPIAEAIIVDEASEDKFSNLNIKKLSEYECFRIILEGQDHKLKQAVIYLIGQTGNEAYVPLIEKIIRDETENELVNLQASQVLDKLKYLSTVKV